MQSDLHLSWTGPFTIREYLDNAISKDKIWEERWPPDRAGVYLVSQDGWHGSPTLDIGPLYVGATTSQSARFRTRIGDLIADLFGFFDDNDKGHHSGAIKLWYWCNEKRIEPFDLYLAWAHADCIRCAELALFHRFPKRKTDGIGLLNMKRPPRCLEHP